jgi:hypothetical protein
VQKSTFLEVLQSAAERQKRFKKKRLNKIIEGLNRYTLWLQNMSSSIDVAVNVSAGIACPVWAPVKFILVVSNIILPNYSSTFLKSSTYTDRSPTTMYVLLKKSST